MQDAFLEHTGFSKQALTRIGLELILRSRDAAARSDHHKVHVGAASCSIDSQGNEKFAINANQIPRALKAKGITSHDTIGHGNATVHGEFALMYEASQSQHLFIGCDTPLCPACMTSAAARGVDAVFVDEKGLDPATNTWVANNLHSWQNISQQIANAAGLSVFSIDAETSKLRTIVLGDKPQKRPPTKEPARIHDLHGLNGLTNSAEFQLLPYLGPKAIGIGRDRTTGAEKLIEARQCLPPGLSDTDVRNTRLATEFAKSHYHFSLDPMMHMAMAAARENLELQNGRIITNYLPGFGRQLDMAFIGVSNIVITNNHIPFSEDAMQTRRQLYNLGIIDYEVTKEKAVTKITEIIRGRHGGNGNGSYAPEPLI
ncbi:MAG: hypothetical protein GC137_08845 [Alphaproteobacteria bacterium]|nr:hypothetical protein [Alphaproteobacteria bacterium]